MFGSEPILLQIFPFSNYSALKLKLERTVDPVIRTWLLHQIRSTKEEILRLMQADSARLNRENRNMEEALLRIRERDDHQ